MLARSAAYRFGGSDLKWGDAETTEGSTAKLLPIQALGVYYSAAAGWPGFRESAHLGGDLGSGMPDDSAADRQGSAGRDCRADRDGMDDCAGLQLHHCAPDRTEDRRSLQAGAPDA